MIRVGFAIANSASWTGGLIYLQNLVQAIMADPDRMVEPVLIADPATPPDHLTGFAGAEIIRTRLVSQSLPVRVLAKGSLALLGRNWPLERFLRAHDIALLSHSGFLGPRARIPALPWLPDFQHVRMPEFFAAEEVAARDRGYLRTARSAPALLLSSNDARGDLAAFAPGAETRSHVLHFMAGMVRGDDPRGPDYLTQQYGISGPFFYLPNQFWKHKNHRLVIDALGLLAAEGHGQVPLVVCTGKPEDRRNPDHFAQLMDHARAVGAEPYFRVLGLIPYADLSVLFRHATALINPSHFEGWSTTVEEAKSMGKTIILSDIPVHREQAPARGLYVPPGDAVAMAQAMVDIQARWSSEEDTAAMALATAAVPARRIAFARDYQRIALAAVQEAGHAQ
ncbi:MAG: hypothetical protein RLZZ08_108 [Pseudomonadota bacterium]|jgi:hypothetical protein